VVIKQHILERNKYPQPQVDNTQFQNINVYSSSAGLYEVSNYGEDLTYEGTIDTAFMSGSTGGTFNQYNVLTTFSSTSSFIVSSSFVVDPEEYINYFNISSSTVTTANSNINWENGELTLITPTPFRLQASGSNNLPGNVIYLQFSSSIRGNIGNESSVANPTYNISSSVIYPLDNERFSLWIKDDGDGPNIIGTQFGIITTLNDYSNQSWLQYYTGSTGVSTIIHSTQDEFYNGELPGTEIIVTTGELNPDNPFKSSTTTAIYYVPTLYSPNITPLDIFLNTNTSPNPGQIYFWKAASYIKINKIDADGIDQSDLLEQLQSIIVNFDSIGNTLAYITSIQEQENYYIYKVGQQYFPDGGVSNINNYSFLVSTSSYYAPLLTDPLTTPSNFNLLAGNTLNYFNTSSGVWTLGDTPNNIIQIQVSGNADIAVPTNLLLRVQANDTLIGSSVLLATGPGSGLTFNTTITFSSSFYHPIENDNIYIGLVRQGGGSTSMLVNNLYISASLLNSSSYNASASLVIFNLSYPNFIYNDYNPLLDNADTPRSSVTWMDIDYSQNPLVPVNFNNILNNSADRAFVQDSNYNSKSWSNLRYNGSRTNSFKNIWVIKIIF